MPHQPEAIGIWDSTPIKFQETVKSAPKRPSANSGAGSEKKSNGLFARLFGK